MVIFLLLFIHVLLKKVFYRRMSILHILEKQAVCMKVILNALFPVLNGQQVILGRGFLLHAELLLLAKLMAMSLIFMSLWVMESMKKVRLQKQDDLQLNITFQILQ